ncbi:MAG: hypothetical protein CMP10_15700 [Zetaproteobacteria bacterium]|nr:hypothetical protein [Pseudobdellovibrionaceae bacterium]
MFSFHYLTNTLLLTSSFLLISCSKAENESQVLGNGKETPSHALIEAIKITCDPDNEENKFDDDYGNFSYFEENKASYLNLEECYITLLAQTAAESTMGMDYSGENRWGSNGGKVRGLTQSRYNDAKVMGLDKKCGSDDKIKTPKFYKGLTYNKLQEDEKDWNVICNLSTGWRQLTQKVGNYRKRSEGCLKHGLAGHLGPNKAGWGHYKKAYDNVYERRHTYLGTETDKGAKYFNAGDPDKVAKWDDIIKKGCDR